MRRTRADIVIVGAGPAGLSVASRIRNSEVVVFEEHSRVGLPKHCAGIVGLTTARIIAGEVSPRVIDHRYNRVCFVTPSYRVDLVFKQHVAFHVNRPLLEEILASKVEALGHRIVYNSRATPHTLRQVLVRGEVLKYTYLVVADGAYSVFRKKLVNDELRFLVGLQIRARARNLDGKTLYVIYTSAIPEFFAWIIPLGDEVLIGAASRSFLNTQKVVYSVQKYLNIPVSSVYEKFGGLIPLHCSLRNPVLGKHIVFHGDSVPLTKPYTGGGLHYIFVLSPLLARLLESARLEEYSALYNRLFYFKNSIERVSVSFLRKINQYSLPTKFVYWLWSLGLVRESDFDSHYELVLKSIGGTPLLAVRVSLSFLKTLYNTISQRVNST